MNKFEKNLDCVIVLTDRVIEKLRKCEWDSDDLQYYIYGLEEIKLFHYCYEGNKQEKLIAIPLENGKKVLFMKLVSDRKNEDIKYFLTTNFWYNKNTNIESTDYYCLQVGEVHVLNKKSTSNYMDNAIDHEQVWSEVLKLKKWEPYESTNIEEKKWNAYFKLYKEILNKQKVEFDLTDIVVKDKKIFASISSISLENREKITDARGEFISIITSNSTTKSKQEKKELGKLTNVDGNSITIDIGEGKKYITPPKEDEEITINGESYRVILTDKLKPAKNETEKKIKFSKNHVHFEALVIINNDREAIEDTNENQEHRTGTIIIDENSRKPTQISASVDYFGEVYQVNTMKRRFEEVKKMPIWKVLSDPEHVSKLPQDLPLEFDNEKLNESQKKAITGAVNATELFLIWGPPGTGKTEVIKEIIKQESKRGNKSLIVSQANLAVDNALSRLYDDERSLPFRIKRKNYNLDGEDIEKVPVIETVPRFYLHFLQNKLLQAQKSTQTITKEQQNIRRKFLQAIENAQKTLTKKNKTVDELREFQQLSDLYHKKINVVGATLMGAGKNVLKSNDEWISDIEHQTDIKEFDTVIIDEVSKATPPELFIPIPLGKKLILVGDFKQLPPMFKMTSKDDKSLEEWADEVGIDEESLDIESTLFERLWTKHTGDADACKAMLTEQYRMHPKIMEIIQPFYMDKDIIISCGLSTEEQKKLNIDIPLLNNKHAIWFGTQTVHGEQGHEKKQGTSFYNEDEIKKVGQLLDKLADINDKSMSIGVITFYGAQLGKLKKEYEYNYKPKFGDGKLVFGTVDRFQGRESDVIICSLVRNNKHGNIGFATKLNRINVAFSRARKALIILGNKQMFAYDSKSKDARSHYLRISKICSPLAPKALEK